MIIFGGKCIDDDSNIEKQFSSITLNSMSSNTKQSSNTTSITDTITEQEKYSLYLNDVYCFDLNQC